MVYQPQQAFDPIGKHGFRSNETDNQVPRSGKIEEISRMDVDIMLFQQFDGEIIIRPRRGNSQHGVPASFDF